MVQLVKHLCEEMGLNPTEKVFFSLCDKISHYGFGCKYFFDNYRNIELWAIELHFKNYCTIGISNFGPAS